jgi:hypothetical protein
VLGQRSVFVGSALGLASVSLTWPSPAPILSKKAMISEFKLKVAVVGLNISFKPVSSRYS